MTNIAKSETFLNFKIWTNWNDEQKFRKYEKIVKKHERSSKFMNIF
jgi:hypothetical protein